MGWNMNRVLFSGVWKLLMDGGGGRDISERMAYESRYLMIPTSPDQSY